MVSAHSPNVLPAAQITLHVPVMVVTDILASQQTACPDVSVLDFETPQHSPPKLYTIYASLLI